VRAIAHGLSVHATLAERASAVDVRYLPMMEVMIPVVRTIPDIRKEAGQLNLRYERQEPGAIKIFRKARQLNGADFLLLTCANTTSF
jgi:hypothetical protein